LMRLIGGSLYVVGFMVMIYNLVATVRSGAAVDAKATVVEPERVAERGAWDLVFSKPMIIITATLVFVLILSTRDLGLWVLATVAVVALGAVAYYVAPRDGEYQWHRLLEGKAFLFSALTLLAVLIGGIVEFVPALALKQNVPTEGAQQPYSALQLAGRE